MDMGLKMPGKSPASDRCAVSFPYISILTFESHYQEEIWPKRLSELPPIAVLTARRFAWQREGNSHQFSSLS